MFAALRNIRAHLYYKEKKAQACLYISWVIQKISPSVYDQHDKTAHWFHSVSEGISSGHSQIVLCWRTIFSVNTEHSIHARLCTFTYTTTLLWTACLVACLWNTPSPMMLPPFYWVAEPATHLSIITSLAGCKLAPILAPTSISPFITEEQRILRPLKAHSASLCVCARMCVFVNVCWHAGAYKWSSYILPSVDF